jgi:hypothetical protein
MLGGLSTPIIHLHQECYSKTTNIIVKTRGADFNNKLINYSLIIFNHLTFLQSTKFRLQFTYSDALADLTVPVLPLRERNTDRDFEF